MGSAQLQRHSSSAMHRQQPSAALLLSTRAVTAPQPDVLVTHLAIRRAGEYDLIGRPVVHDDGLVRFLASCYDCVQCVPHVLSHDARLERRAVGVTRLSPDGVFLYFDLALSSHCGSFRASLRLARSLVERPQLTRWSVDELVVLFTLQAGTPACFGLRRTSSWCDMMGVCGSKQMANMLPELTNCAYDKRAWQHVGDC